MVVITKKRDVAAKYLDYLKRELAMLGTALSGRRQVVQYHWGGGTPTYLSPAQMADLHQAVATHFDIDPDGEASIEVDPRVTTFEQLDLLRQLGFNRLSMGVQDFTPAVQAAVNRVQPVEMTRALFDHARRLGFASINVDLIYGLPLQTRASFATTVDTVLAMRPDRVAVYSLALVPWIRAHQKGLPMADLPDAEAKLELFVEAMQRFVAAGYRQIGMDHFALPDDELAKASDAGRLHRNFMGYTTRPAPDMVGVGVSSIGDVSGAFAQNVKPLAAYYDALDAGQFPIERGYRLDRDDRLRRFVITELMCNFRVRQADLGERFGVALPLYFALEIEELERAQWLTASYAYCRRPGGDRERPALRAQHRHALRPVPAPHDQRRPGVLEDHLRGQAPHSGLVSRVLEFVEPQPDAGQRSYGRALALPVAITEQTC